MQHVFEAEREILMRIRLIIKEGKTSEYFKQDPEKMRMLDDARAGDLEAKKLVKRHASRFGGSNKEQKNLLNKLVSSFEILIFTTDDPETRIINYFSKNVEKLKYIPYIINKIINRNPGLGEYREILYVFWPIFIHVFNDMSGITIKKYLNIFFNNNITQRYLEYFDENRAMFFEVFKKLNIPPSINISDLQVFLRDK